MKIDDDDQVTGRFVSFHRTVNWF